MRPFVRTLYGGAAAGALLLASGFARAEDAKGAKDADSARILFREGRALVSDGKYSEACEKFEQSLKLDAGIGTKFNLADCYEHLGRTATAHALFLDVAAIARQAGQADREQAAEGRAKSLEPQLHQLTINVKGDQSGLTIQRDGVEVLPSKWGVPQAVDPGTYNIAVTAPGKKAWSQKVEVPRSGDATLEIPELEDEAAAPKAAVVAAAAPEPVKEKTPPAEPKEESTDLTVPLIIYGGLGVGAVLATTALILYKSANDKAEAICPSSVDCSSEDIARHDQYVNDAKDARTLAYVGLGVAGAAVITGGTIALLRSHSDSSAHASVSAAPILAPGLYGGAIGGTF
jgi:tetratricopeptide (TPR) repeat protein